jgi:hypothetical protein
MQLRITLLLLILMVCLPELTVGQDDWKLRRRHPLLLESALIEPENTIFLHTGVEFEEDSGDFPTTKFPIHLQWSITDRLAVMGGFEPLIFNKGELWSRGATNSTFSSLIGITESNGWLPALAFRQDLLPPTGLFSTGKWNTTSSLLSTWNRDEWQLHLNGAYTFGGHDDREHIMASEVDRYRVITGLEYCPLQKPFTLLVSFAATKPIRPKPFEPVIELGGRIRLMHGFIVNLGAGRSLKESAGPDYLLRFTVSLQLN